MWLDRLFASAGYKDQKELVRRHAPDDEPRASLSGRTGFQRRYHDPGCFRKAADIPAARIDGLIAQMQRLLNVDGYEILTFSRSENRIELNVSKLKRQFDLE